MAVRWASAGYTASGWRMLAVLASMALLAGCGGGDSRLDELRALPEATLVYPGSEEVNSGGREAEMTVSGPLSAATWRWLGVDASADEIERFYAEELESHGWEEGGGSSGIPMTSEFGARAWHKDDAVFRLGFPRPDHFADPEPFSRYETVYDVRLIGKQVDP